MTHGSPELDEDAAKLRALGADPGPEFEDHDHILTKAEFHALVELGAITPDDGICIFVDGENANEKWDWKTPWDKNCTRVQWYNK